LQNPPDTGLLVRVKLNRTARVGQGQVIAVECAQPGVVDPVTYKAVAEEKTS
jgi:hypothetical protein